VTVRSLILAPGTCRAGEDVASVLSGGVATPPLTGITPTGSSRREAKTFGVPRGAVRSAV
jgi:hypothetical protein